MFNSLREELNKIALMEDEELEMMDSDKIVGGDDGAADDEIVDDENMLEEEEEDEIADEVENGHEEPSAAEIDSIVESILLAESDDDYGYGEDYDTYDYDDYDYLGEGPDCFDDCDDDDYDDDDDDSIDFDDGVIGDGRTVKGDPDDDEYDDVDIDGTTNSIHGDTEIDLKEDLDEDTEEELDDILETYLGKCDDPCPVCGGSGCKHCLGATSNDIFGDSSDMPLGNVPPSPQYDMLRARGATGGEFVDYGNSNYKRYGKVFLDKDIMDHMTVEREPYDDEGDDYNLYATAGNIADDDENEEFYGIRSRVKTDSLYGRHNIDNINAAQLGDRYEDHEDALDESVAAFLDQYLN